MPRCDCRNIRETCSKCYKDQRRIENEAREQEIAFRLADTKAIRQSIDQQLHLLYQVLKPFNLWAVDPWTSETRLLRLEKAMSEAYEILKTASDPFVDDDDAHA